jgi:AcrR family transcriptional regulator
VNRLLDEWGSHERLTMRAVAKEVGVAAPSIYLHFSDKTELIWAALSDKYEQLAASMRAADETAEPSDVRGRLLAQARAYCRFGLEYPGHYRLMYEIRQPAPEPGRIGRHPARLVSRRLREAVARCLESGYALSLPPNQAAHTLWAGLHGIVSLQHGLAVNADGDLVMGLTEGLAEGLVDSIVARDRGSMPVCPPDTEVERMITTTVLADD